MSTGEKTGIVNIALGVIYGVLTLNMGKASVGNPYEPMVFPLMLAGVMILCGFFLYLGEHKKRKALEEKATPVKVEKKGFVLTYEVKMIIFICIVSTLYGLLFDRIGYVLSTTFFMGSLLFAFNDGMKKWLQNVIIAVSFSVIIYLAFSKVFYIPLPMLPYFNI